MWNLLNRYHNQIILFSVGYYLVVLTFQIKEVPITLGLIGFWAGFVFHKEVFKKFKKALTSPFVLAWILFFVWMVIGLEYSPDPGMGVKILVRKIGLLLWPLGIVGEEKVFREGKNTLLKTFLFGLAGTAIVSIFIALARYLQEGNSKVFFYHEIGQWTGISMHYLAMYFSVGFILTLFFIRKGLLNKPIGIALNVLFLLMIALLSVRIQFIALPIGFGALLWQIWGTKKAIIGLSGFIALLLLTIVFLPGPKRRFLETVDEIRSIESMVNKKQTNHRVFIWKYGWEVIQENFWLGVGTGGAHVEVSEKLKNCKAKFWDGKSSYYLYERPYNFHNQFLEVWGGNGLIGLLLFSGLFFYILIKSTLSGDAIAVSVLLVVFVSFLTESMLERQAGVLFFGFFHALFWVPDKKSKGKKKTHVATPM